MTHSAYQIPQTGYYRARISEDKKTPAYALGSTYRGVSRKASSQLMPIVPDYTETSAYWDGITHSSAATARHHGWTVGTKLVGDEGYGPSTIEITAIGEESVLAKTRQSPHGTFREHSWSFSCRDWQVVR